MNCEQFSHSPVDKKSKRSMPTAPQSTQGLRHMPAIHRAHGGAAAPGALTGTGWSLLAVCVFCVCLCASVFVYVCVLDNWWSFFWQLDVRAHVLVCLEEEGRILKAYVCVLGL